LTNFGILDYKKNLEALGVRNPLLHWFESYLENRMQRVVIEGQSTEWEKVGSRFPPVWVLGPLLFLIYINDLTDDLESCPFNFAEIQFSLKLAIIQWIPDNF
jgi:hypothetical protein